MSSTKESQKPLRLPPPPLIREQRAAFSPFSKIARPHFLANIKARYVNRKRIPYKLCRSIAHNVGRG